MSPEARVLAPNAAGSDFAFSSASLSYIRRGFSSAGLDFPNQFEISGGRTWYAQQPFMRYARVSFTQNYVFAPGNFVFGGVSREIQKTMSAREDVDSWALSGGVRVTTNNQDRVTFSVNAKKSNSLDSNLDFQQITFSTRYAVARPIAGVSIDFGMSIGKKNHQTSRFSRFGRQSDIISLDVTGVFNRIEYFGFSPSVTLTANQTASTIGLYDSRGIGFRFGIQSSF
jgi:hypothetical protein